MNDRTTEAEEDNDARLNLLYRLEKIKTIVEGFRTFEDSWMSQSAIRTQRDLLKTVCDAIMWFSVEGDDQ